MIIELNEQQFFTLKNSLEYLTAFLRTAEDLMEIKKVLNQMETDAALAALKPEDVTKI